MSLSWRFCKPRFNKIPSGVFGRFLCFLSLHKFTYEQEEVESSDGVVETTLVKCRREGCIEFYLI